MSPEIRHYYEFREFRFDPLKRVLWRDGEVVTLMPKASQVLLLLVESRGNLIEREEILEKVWPDSFVEEGNLNHAVSALRKALGGKGMIQTVSRRGYRFTPYVRQVIGNPTDLIIEKRILSQTLIEEFSGEDVIERPNRLAGLHLPRTWLVFAALMLILMVAGLTMWRFNQSNRTVSALKIKSLAVMPFSNVQGNEDEKLLAEALTDSIIAKLGAFSDLTVRPANSSREAQRTFQSIREIGLNLQVDTILQGSFFRNGVKKQVTLNLQLLRCADGELLWEKTVVQDGDNLLALQTNAAAQVAEKLISDLTDHQRQMLAKHPTDNMPAFRSYLKGNFYLAKRSVQFSPLALQSYQEAIARDPNFALAYVGLADIYAMTKSPAPEAEIYLQKALELDEELAEAHASLGFIQMFHKWDWAGSEASFRRALELNPNSAKARQWLATYFALHRRFDEAESEIRRALEIDPNSIPINTDLCEILYYKRDFEAARRQCEAALRLDPIFAFAHRHLAKIYFFLNDHEKAFQHEIATDASAPEKMEKAFRQAGYRGLVEAKLAVGYGFTYEFARYYMQLGEPEKALQILENESDHQSFLVVFANADPLFDNLRNQPRFRALIRRLNLPQ